MSVVVDAVNHEEELLGWEKSPFTKHSMALAFLEPYRKLWESTLYFQTEYAKWLNGPLLDLNPQGMDEDISNIVRTMFQLTKIFAENPIPRKVAETIRTKLDKFKQHLPLLSVLRSPGLKARHWEQMDQIIGQKILPEPTTSFAKIIELNLSSHLPEFEKIADVATKQYSLQKGMDKMKEAWEPLIIESIEYRDSGTRILSSVEDMELILEDQIVKAQTMRSSPFIKPIEEELIAWEARLLRIQETMDLWLQVQSTWLYLEPIFSSEDIMNQMPTEGKKFKTVDKCWREIMRNLADNPQALSVTHNQHLLPKLKDSNSLLEEIQKGLNEYLEKKRIFFPRFFFLSNDELLEILSETKDPTRVQPHMKKCFEGIASLTFQEGNRIIAMCSGENERVTLKEVIDPATANGAVEKWLVQVERVMQASIHEHVTKGMKSYPETPREKWILDWPGQIVICVSQIFWTKEVEAAIREGGAAGLRNYKEKCTRQLEELANLVRGELTPMARATLSALCVIDVHARDVVANLEALMIRDESDFEWLSQLRYYWNQNEVYVHMMNAKIKYGYEYLGNSSRLVITSLTDRCYRTLISALDMNLGGAPEGPAGTGKTETVKDLAKALAKQCVVFNCSDGLDYLAMGKFFKGLAASGAWACFDEFNRIDLEVLSVVAQQILTIQRAVASKSETLNFEGTVLKLNTGCAVFITMNRRFE